MVGRFFFPSSVEVPSFQFIDSVEDGHYCVATEHAPNDVSSEDGRTPFRGQAVEQSAEMRSALEVLRNCTVML